MISNSRVFYVCIPNLNYLLGRALGYPDSEDGLPSSLVDSTISVTAELHRDPTQNTLPSMLLDAQNGLPIEVEVIVGEVVRMAKKMNVDIPVSRIFADDIAVDNGNHCSVLKPYILCWLSSRTKFLVG